MPLSVPRNGEVCRHLENEFFNSAILRAPCIVSGACEILSFSLLKPSADASLNILHYVGRTAGIPLAQILLATS